MKYFEEQIEGEFKRIYRGSIAKSGWCVEITNKGIRFGFPSNLLYSIEEGKEMMEWISRNLPKKVYILHKEYGYNPLDNFSGGDLYIKQEDIKEEYR